MGGLVSASSPCSLVQWQENSLSFCYLFSFLVYNPPENTPDTIASSLPAFSPGSDHPLPPAHLPHLRGVQTISTFHGSTENVTEDVCTAVGTGATAGPRFSAVSWEVQQTQ